MNDSYRTLPPLEPTGARDQYHASRVAAQHAGMQLSGTSMRTAALARVAMAVVMSVTDGHGGEDGLGGLRVPTSAPSQASGSHLDLNHSPCVLYGIQ